MATTICLPRAGRRRGVGIDATFENGVWRCPDERLRAYLEATSKESPIPREDEERHALWVCTRVGGAMIPSSPPPAPVSPPRGS